MASTPANERSRASTVSDPQPQSQPPSNLNREDVADWLAIDRALTHIQSVIPSHPYVLTIPQDVEPRYHHPNDDYRQQWRRGTPFYDREHEAQQYMTWHLYEPGDMYLQHPTRPREEREDASSRVGTPKPGSGGVKKTISLGAYKKKVAGATPGPEETKKAEVNGIKKEGAEQKPSDERKSVEKPAVKGPIERVKADEEMLGAMGDEQDVVPPAAKKGKTEGSKDLKRKRPDDDEDTKELKRRREDSKMSEEREAKESEKAEREHAPQKQNEAPQQFANANLSPAKKKTLQHADPSSEERATEKAKTPRPPNAQPAVKPEPKPAEGEPSKADEPQGLDKTAPCPPTSTQEGDDMALPPRLSPLREEKKEEKEEFSFVLPPRLSPTLPANITATLEARKHYRSTSKASAGDSLTPPRKAMENGVAKRKSPVNGFRANSSSPMVRSDAEDNKRAKTSAPTVRSPSPSGGESEIAVGKNAAPTKERKPRLVVKLKFKQRGTRESVKQLLKLPAAKKKPEPKASPTALKATDGRHREQRDPSGKGVAQKVGPATKGLARKVEKSATSTPTPSEKRGRDDDSESDGRAKKRKKADIAVYEPPAKRKKAPPESLNLKKTTPSTPSQPAQQPPTPASSVKQPASQPTPNVNAGRKSGKELLAAATSSSMKREASHDSQAQAPTPSASSSSPAASSASQLQATAVPKSTPTNATSTPAPSQPKTQRQTDWEAQRKIYDDLGRELKRAATADLTALSTTKPAPTKDETTRLRTHAALKTLESLLAFILSFVSDDEAQLAASPRLPPRTRHWRTLRDYFPFVKRNTEPFPLLQGLASALAVVFCARVLDLGGEEKWAGMGVDVVGGFWGMLRREGQVAEARLDGKVLREKFPRAWEMGVGGQVEEEAGLEPGRFGGVFRMPIGVQTRPVVAVRAAHAILGEWVEREGVGYEMRLKLG